MGAGAASNAVGATTTGGLQPTTVSGGMGGTAQTVCDAQGNCTCINVGMLGRSGTYGAVPGQDGSAALVAWLNTNSSAAASNFTTKPELTEEFLAGYNVLILQALETAEGAGQQWQFSPAEVAAFEAWVRAGGGVIALTGYGAYPDEATPTNQLLAFSGLQYAGLGGAGDTYGDGTCPDACCYCLGNSVPSGGFDASHPISANMQAVGAFWGRSVNAPAGAQVVAADGSKVLGASMQVDAGRVFMFHDEWVTYTSQWDGSGLQTTCLYNDPNNPCNNIHPSTSYQVEQFWYNALRWASGDIACFDIDIDVIIK
jgi:hypothetical protein